MPSSTSGTRSTSGSARSRKDAYLIHGRKVGRDENRADGFSFYRLCSYCRRRPHLRPAPSAATGGMEPCSSMNTVSLAGQTVTWNTEAFTGQRCRRARGRPVFRLSGRPRPAFRPSTPCRRRRPTRKLETSDPRPVSHRCVPDLHSATEHAPGQYVMEVCDDPCENRLAYIWGAPRGQVVSGDIEAGLSGRIATLSQKVSDLRWSTEGPCSESCETLEQWVRAEMAVAEEKLDMASNGTRTKGHRAREAPRIARGTGGTRGRFPISACRRHRRACTWRVV